MRFFITFSVRAKRKIFIDIAVFCFVLMATDDDDGRVTLFFSFEMHGTHYVDQSK